MVDIAEAYFHLRPFRVTASDIERLGKQAALIAGEVAADIYSPETELIVRLSAGSLKGWTTVVAVSLSAAVAGYDFIANYKGFKEGVAEIVSDGRRFSSKFNTTFLSQATKAEGAVFRKERRTKTPGKLLRAASRLDWLQEHQAQLSKKDIASEKAAISRILRDALDDLDEPDQLYVRKLLTPEDDETPEEPRVALRQEVMAQLPLFRVEHSSSELSLPPDYMERFRVAEFLSNTRRLRSAQ